MSTDREEFVDDRERADRIPEDAPIREIAPDDFVARSSHQTLRAALREAEQATSRPPRELPRCPDCGSIQLRRKRERYRMEHRREQAYKCLSCGHHCDEPAPSIEETAPGDQTDLREVTR